VPPFPTSNLPFIVKILFPMFSILIFWPMIVEWSCNFH
jgi:hypothetical protein